MPPAPRGAGGSETRALILAIVWMVLIEGACLLLWRGGWLARHAAMAHWLAVGALPPALALWTTRPPGQ